MSQTTRFFLTHSLLLIISLVLLLLYVPVGGTLDLAFIQPWMDQTGHFFARNDWYLAELNHTIVKDVIIAAYVSIFLLWLASFKMNRLAQRRWHYGYFFWQVILGTSLIGLLKSQSAHACPWNMTQSTLTGFAWNFNLENGHCFPGGHASTGFALITGYFVFRLLQPARAYFYLIAALILGFAMGWAQMMRGAHFLSHNLWTGWIIWTLNLAAYGLFYRRFILNPVGR